MRVLEVGFSTISGATVDAAGRLYFVDRHQQRIYSWSEKDGLNIVRHDALDPVSLAADKSGHLLVVSSAGPESTVYSITPGAPADEIAVLQPQPTAPRPGAAAVLPANVWDNGEFANQLDLTTYEYMTLAQMFARDVTTPSRPAVRVARRQSVSPRRPRVPSGARRFVSGDGSDGLALVVQPGDVRIRDCAARA